MIIFMAGSALCAGAWSMTSLILFRGLQGLGAGSIMATVNTLAGDLYAIEERGRVQGWLSSVWGISAVFGPTLGGPLAQYASWRWIFLINLPLGAAAITLIARYLHEQVSRTRHQIDVAGAVTILLAAGALIFGLLQGGVAWAWWSRPSIAVFAVAALATAAAVIAERRAAEPVVATIIVILVIIPRQLAVTAAAPSGPVSPGDAAAGDVAVSESPDTRDLPS